VSGGGRPADGERLSAALTRWARRRGFQVAWGHPAVVETVRREIDHRARAGELESTFYRRRLSWFRYLDGVDLPATRSVLVVAAPKPAHRLVFHLGEHPFEATVPPTYRSGGSTFSGLTRGLRAGPLHGFGLVRLPAPAKAIAVHLGLAVYGRNNITYTEATGSYHFLAVYATDADLGAGRRVDGEAERALPRCRTCRLCLGACPTGAIGEDRFLLRAERCVAYLSEHAGPWPSWLAPAAHDCLVGCLVCQEVCPENKGRLRVERVKQAFNSEETEILLGDPGLSGPGGKAVRVKLQRLGLPGYEAVIGRNLLALIQASRGEDTVGR
jgi:epoxyqueuosine reductase